MLAPIPWLKDYIDIKLSLKDLMWRLTEVGATTEASHETESERVLDVEVTPNRPDWLSIVGIAREIAAIQGTKIKFPKIPEIPTKKSNLPISVAVDSSLCPRYTAISIAGVTVRPSPKWLKLKLKLVGLRPINNLVDITNFVMFELGVPVHVFDYDKLESKKLSMQKAAGGETFTSVDGISYKLPKDAIIIKDGNRVVDLCGLKGGENTGISESTKNIFIHVPVYIPQLIRRTSRSLKLASEASYIYERGANAGGTVDTLERVVDLVLRLAGGTVAASLIDVRREKFEPWPLTLSLARLEKVLGPQIPAEKLVSILASLNLSPKKTKDKIVCTIPTYRGDLKIEEDLIEEVARIYGYNKFPKTLPVGETAKEKIPYYFDDSFHLELKNLLTSAGYSEAATFSLVSEALLTKTMQKPQEHLKLSNPVSLDFEYLRRSLFPNLLTAVSLNASENDLKLFELGKVYLGSAEKPDEVYFISGIQKGSTFSELKGALDFLLTRANVKDYTYNQDDGANQIWHPFKSGVVTAGSKTIGTYGAINPRVLDGLGIKEEVFAFELDVAALVSAIRPKTYKSIPKYPAQIEDITLTLPARTKIGEVVKFVPSITNYVSRVELVDTFENAYTFRVWYQNPKKTMTDDEVAKEREKILKELGQKFGASVKN